MNPIRPTTAAEAVSRARIAAGPSGSGIVYQLIDGGGGGRDPWAPLPTPTGRCDCVGFACWASGFARHQAAFGQYEGDINCDSAIFDSDAGRTFFSEFQVPMPGDWLVYGSAHRGLPGGRVGHVAIIVDVPPNWRLDGTGNGYTALRVVQCAAFHGRAIRETDGAFWDGPDHAGRPKHSRILRPNRYVAAAPAPHEMTAALLGGLLPALEAPHGDPGDPGARQRAMAAVAAWATTAKKP